MALQINSQLVGLAWVNLTHTVSADEVQRNSIWFTIFVHEAISERRITLALVLKAETLVVHEEVGKRVIDGAGRH